MMKGKNLSNAFLAKDINTTVYLKNRSPTRSLYNVTPFKAFYGSKPAVHNLKVFGCKAFAHISKENRNNFDTKSIKRIFIGFCSEFKAYKLFDPSTHKVVVGRNVLFHEHEARNHDNNIHEECNRLIDEGVKEEKQEPSQQQPLQQQPQLQRQQQHQQEGVKEEKQQPSQQQPSQPQPPQQQTSQQ